MISDPPSLDDYPTLRTDITRTVQLALAEDIGEGDITAQLIPADKTANATIITREDCVVCGTAWVEEVFHQLDPTVTIHWQAADGDQVAAGSTLCRLAGNARILLTGERTALNFLQLLSGTATTARQYADLVKDSPLKILDTRKTIPGLRTAQKYAVRCGGCYNHRLGLYDAFLIKENHIAACGGITAAIQLARQQQPDKPVEVEVENLEELKEAVKAKADVVMLDNFSEADLKQAANLPAGHTQLEVSGNITDSQIKKLGGASVTYCSSGSLTKHISAVDLSMGLLMD